MTPLEATVFFNKGTKAGAKNPKMGLIADHIAIGEFHLYLLLRPPGRKRRVKQFPEKNLTPHSDPGFGPLVYTSGP